MFMFWDNSLSSTLQDNIGSVTHLKVLDMSRSKVKYFPNSINIKVLV